MSNYAITLGSGSAVELTPVSDQAPEKLTGLDAMIHALSKEPKASLTPLDDSGTPIGHGPNWKLVAPNPSSPDRSTQAIHFLRLPSPNPDLAQRLSRDPRVAKVESLSSALAVPKAISPPIAAGPFWGIKQCGFSQAVWTALEQGDDPGPIAVIDDGNQTNIPKWHDYVTYHAMPQGGSSSADHASEVVVVVGPHAVNGHTAPGCCSAKVDLYNVCDENGTFDQAAIAQALVAAAKASTVVVNMSFHLPSLSQAVETAIAACTQKGVLLVAAMTDTSLPDSVFPAKHDDVIAVGGTSFNDTLSASTIPADYIAIAAPSERITTIGGTNRGTSFAAPMVTAAIWLARRRRPKLAPAEIARRVLRSTKPIPGHPSLKYGRLDMPTLVTELQKP